jgi:hypothetical protein
VNDRLEKMKARESELKMKEEAIREREQKA